MAPCPECGPGMGSARVRALRAFPSPAPHLTAGVGMALLTVGDGNQSRKVESLTGGKQEPEPQQPP